MLPGIENGFGKECPVLAGLNHPEKLFSVSPRSRVLPYHPDRPAPEIRPESRDPLLASGDENTNTAPSNSTSKPAVTYHKRDRSTRTIATHS